MLFYLKEYCYNHTKNCFSPIIEKQTNNNLCSPTDIVKQ